MLLHVSPAIFEKFKEKKQNVVIPLRETIDALYSITGFESMLEDIQAALENKNPQIKAETFSLLKTLNDTDGTVRENAAEALGTALKVVGDRMMTPFLQEVDALKMAKIKDFCDKAVVKQTVEKKNLYLHHLL
ncbi:protein mini spindles [Caerostris extrusa]|uniref:Protein mini spindles n=1 Tax=Caerostris extrusa TaxID=172846 RepID=A0AAV4UU80_CAEEX|nr:protein mini spindles [Caerostris extrusa]